MNVLITRKNVGQLIGFFLLILSFWCNYLSAYFLTFNLTYLVGFLLVSSLFFLVKISVSNFLVFLIISLFLFGISPSPTIIVTLFPTLGFLFSGKLKFQGSNHLTKYLTVSLYLFFVLFYLFVGEDSSASHNYLSVIIVYAAIAEYLLFKSISKSYIPLILFCFFIIGNRSSIFLLILFFRSRFFIVAFLALAFLFILMTIGEIEIFKIFQVLFNEGGILNRSYVETRGSYIDEFLSKFNFFRLSYSNWKFSQVPETSNGFYDLHNSFLTLIVRDSYLGLFKLFLWILQLIFLPFGLFTGITLRANYDTFLLGGVNDILVYSLIGQNIRNFIPQLKFDK